jgi:hypothetical protein
MTLLFLGVDISLNAAASRSVLDLLACHTLSVLGRFLPSICLYKGLDSCLCRSLCHYSSIYAFQSVARARDNQNALSCNWHAALTPKQQHQNDMQPVLTVPEAAADSTIRFQLNVSVACVCLLSTQILHCLAA